MRIFENTIIKDINKLNHKIKIIKEDGTDKLQVISDFDKTLSYEFVNGKRHRSLIAQIRDGGYLEADYPRRAEGLFEKYHPFEIDSNLSFEEKKEKMNEWWSTHIKLQSECKMNKIVVEEINNKHEIILRSRVSSFLQLCYEKEIPVLILSSAVGDFITFVLNDYNVLFPNIHVISNFYDYDTNGFVLPYYKDNKIIHVLNKNEAEIKNTPYFEKIKNKQNIILIGDSIDDLLMSEGIDYKERITIGFLNKDTEKYIELYKDKFDVVITADRSFEQVYELLKKITG